jgi:periplasmic divalent cation tolerance protein
MDDRPLLVLVTAPAEGDVAERLARGLVEARLAACVNLVPGLRSFYRWQGEIADDLEVQLLIKTHEGRFDALVAWVQNHHPYEVPEVVALPIERGAAPYLAWLRDETDDRG